MCALEHPLGCGTLFPGGAARSKSTLVLEAPQGRTQPPDGNEDEDQDEQIAHVEGRRPCATAVETPGF